VIRFADRFEQTRNAPAAPTQHEWSGQFDTLESIRFVRGPDAKVSGNTATVTGVTIAQKVSRTGRNTVTCRMVNEGAEWKTRRRPGFSAGYQLRIVGRERH
jgi:hypothetical protein